MLSIVFGTIYGAAQQTLRMSANDPQIQLAEDAAASLNKGTDPQEFAKTKVDIAKSAAPFLIIYDKSGHVVAGSGTLDNHSPTIPLGVLKSSDKKDYNAVTWQPESPQKKIRLASVNVSANGYYVTAGRSLKEVESRDQKIMGMVFVAWIATISVVVLLPYLYKKVA